MLETLCLIRAPGGDGCVSCGCELEECYGHLRSGFDPVRMVFYSAGPVGVMKVCRNHECPLFGEPLDFREDKE